MADTRDVLERTATIAVVGLSRHPEKSAHSVPAQLAKYGFEVIPVNPYADEILGRRAYHSLEDVDEPVDLVLVFRPSGDAPPIARQAVAIGAKALWLQSGIRSAEARAIAEGAGLDYIEDRCIAIERSIHQIRRA